MNMENAIVSSIAQAKADAQKLIKQYQKQKRQAKSKTAETVEDAARIVHKNIDNY